MGKKGDEQTPNSQRVANNLVRQFDPLGTVSLKKMFGGHGIFCDNKMFCIVDSKGNSFLKADETNKPDFEKMGASQHSRMPYFSIPDEIVNNPESLLHWAQKSIGIALKK